MTIVWFDEIESNAIHQVGGKGANLGRMAQAGLPVPPGFCVTTQAYQQFIAEANLWPEMAQWLATLPPRPAGEAIRQRLESAPMPPAIATAIRAAYGRLNGGRAAVAVRSSATAEDLADASFAGQQETFLGIRGAESLVYHVQRCWASLWTERAIAYRSRSHFAHDTVSLSVVVQEMIASEVAGVLFTANPVTNRRDEMLVNASFGLGESVVSGRVTPDTYRLARRRQFVVLEKIRGAKATRIDMNGHGAQETAVEVELRQRLCLDDAALRRLRELGETVERHYGQPQDIEWGLAQGQLYLLQTRPITSLATAAAPPPTLSKAQRVILNDLLEHYPEPPYPLDCAAVRDSYQQLVDTLAAYGVSLPPSADIIRLDDHGLASVHPPRPALNVRFPAAFVTLARSLQTNPRRWLDEQQPAFQAELDALARVEVTTLANDALVRFIRSAVAVTSRVGLIRFRDFIVPAVARSSWLKLLLGLTRDGRQVSVMDLLGDLPYQTAVIDQALHRLAQEAERLPQASAILLHTEMDAMMAGLADHPEGRAFLDKVNAFLTRFGARTMKMYLPFSNRSWTENPASLLATVAVLLRSPKRPAEATAPYAALRQRLLDQLPGWLRAPFTALLEQFRMGHVARESTLYTIEEGFLHARRGVDEAARRLQAAGALPQAELAVYLTLEELCAALSGNLLPAAVVGLASRRRQARPAAMQAWRGQWQQSRPGAGAAAVKGLPGSPGLAAGTVKVIAGPAEFDKLQPGDVLVCPYTDPAWTPLFTLACAVVADTGGPLSHAAIVAREYRIPAVLGAQGATLIFRDGDSISVNGNSGEVLRM